ARRFDLARLEQIAEELGVPDEQAGPAAPARAPERRGTAAETEGMGVRLAPKVERPAREPHAALAAPAAAGSTPAAPPDAPRPMRPAPPPDARPVIRQAPVQAALELFEPA